MRIYTIDPLKSRSMHRPLDPISWLDCLVFIICLIPPLLLSPRVGLFRVLLWLVTALPFFLFRLPFAIFKDRVILPHNRQPDFVRSSTLFQEFILRLVKYAFSNLHSDMGREFFGKWVALPFFRFRLLRNGFWPSNVSYWKPEEIYRNGVRAVWTKTLQDIEPDIVLYYIHGGGFTMGSPYFYLEFLIFWAAKLKEAGFKNPCVFALDYTLVPDLKFPSQLNEAYRGYEVLNDLAKTADLVICGDSAGGNIALSLLLELARPRETHLKKKPRSLRKPSYATLISPWTVLVSPKNRNTVNDFLDADQLQAYGILYADSPETNDPYKSPGSCSDPKWWTEAIPEKGIHIVYGNQEVFTEEIKSFISQLGKLGTVKLSVSEKATVHAWPVVEMFLGTTQREREEGIQLMTNMIANSLCHEGKELSS